MTPAVLDREEVIDSDKSPDSMIKHYVCGCKFDIAFCGYDCSDRPSPTRTGRVDCVVCENLWRNLRRCPDCGTRTWG